MERVLYLTGVVAGILIGYLDSRPSWDDTGVTVGLVFIAAAILAALTPRRPWVAALCVGVWVPTFGILLRSNYGSLLALVIAFLGAYAGALARKAIPA